MIMLGKTRDSENEEKAGTRLEPTSVTDWARVSSPSRCVIKASKITSAVLVFEGASREYLQLVVGAVMDGGAAP
jgi:hypothetical protein